MVEWLKIFGLGFFNDKLAAKSEKYGFVSVVLAIVLSFLFFMFGFMAADVVPFSTHYDNAGDYRQFIYNAVSETGAQVEIKDGHASCERIINTFTNDSDKAAFSMSGYDLIIDTRASDMLINFTQVAVKDGKELGYDAYMLLSDKEKAGYAIENRYTDEELIITEEKVEAFESYIAGISKEGADNYNAEAASDYKKIKEGNLSADAYGKEIYYLYVKYYYTNVESALMSAKAPVLCDYYYLNFMLNDNENYFYIFDDICTGSFKTDKNIPAMFAGYYRGCDEGVLGKNSVDRFVKDVYYNSVSYSMSSYFTGAMQMAPGYILTPIIVGFILYLICKGTKKQFGQKFTGCYKTVNSFVWISALLTGLLTFTLGFFVFSRKLYLFMPLIFALILIIRTAVFYITRSIKEGKTEEKEQSNREIF